ncbi:hypothetical protein [Sulfurimonas sp.]|uniref:hypothetical protein n=1 Tax=Sulfurimonas sp. TaxID=2022749 RepID=UPI002B4A14D6|nr:hypothetical protein [Sulfurimonas sp.]
MTTHLIGQLLEVKPSEYTNKKTDKVSYSTDLTVMFDGIDEEGFRKVSVETVNTDEEYYEELKGSIGKFIALAYHSSIDQWGQKFYADRSMAVLTLDKNPLDYSKFKRTKQEYKK